MPGGRGGERIGIGGERRQNRVGDRGSVGREAVQESSVHRYSRGHAAIYLDGLWLSQEHQGEAPGLCLCRRWQQLSPSRISVASKAGLRDKGKGTRAPRWVHLSVSL